jgi:hypothetical protein
MVTVMSAITVSPSAPPVSAFKPDGTSMDTTSDSLAWLRM